MAIWSVFLVLALVFGTMVVMQTRRPRSSAVPAEIVELTPERREQVVLYTRSALYTKAYLLDFFCGDYAWPEAFEPDEVSPVIDEVNAELARERESWSELTDCDRLDKAFQALRDRGLIAPQNAGYTQSDGFEDCNEIYHESPDKEHILGCCFYHEQDLERAVLGGGLYFAFGAYAADENEGTSISVGEMICEELERTGLQVEWEKTVSSRPCVPNFLWQRRQPLKRPATRFSSTCKVFVHKSVKGEPWPDVIAGRHLHSHTVPRDAECNEVSCAWKREDSKIKKVPHMTTPATLSLFGQISYNEN